MARTNRVTPASTGFAALFLALTMALTALVAAPAAQAAPQLVLQGAQTSGSLPVVEGSYPKPNDGGQVFYIQRSTNPNTVVYASKVAGGQIDSSAPISAYWRRYGSNGAAKALSGLERRVAYGVNAKAAGNGTYRVTFRALPSKTMTLRMADGRPALFTDTSKGEARMIYAYLDVKDGLIPQVTGLKMIGRLSSGQYITETYQVKGGAL